MPLKLLSPWRARPLGLGLHSYVKLSASSTTVMTVGHTPFVESQLLVPAVVLEWLVPCLLAPLELS